MKIVYISPECFESCPCLHGVIFTDGTSLHSTQMLADDIYRAMKLNQQPMTAHEESHLQPVQPRRFRIPVCRISASMRSILKALLVPV